MRAVSLTACRTARSGPAAGPRSDPRPPARRRDRASRRLPCGAAASGCSKPSGRRSAKATWSSAPPTSPWARRARPSTRGWPRCRARRVLVVGSHEFVNDLPGPKDHGFEAVYATLVCDSDRPLLLTHEPVETMPAGCAKVRGHLHGDPGGGPRRGGRGATCTNVELLGYRPVRLAELAATAQALLAGAVAPQTTTMRTIALAPRKGAAARRRERGWPSERHEQVRVGRRSADLCRQPRSTDGYARSSSLSCESSTRRARTSWESLGARSVTVIGAAYLTWSGVRCSGPLRRGPWMGRAAAGRRRHHATAPEPVPALRRVFVSRVRPV